MAWIYSGRTLRQCRVYTFGTFSNKIMAMRDYKFRAFNKTTEIMYYPKCTQDEYNHYLQIGAGGFWLYNKEGKLICTSNKGDVLMQATPRKDKNGRQIWEGDIVNSGNGEIFWDEKFCQFRVRWHDKTFKRVRGANPDYRGGEMLFWNSEIAWEVIGNVYEHAHLLNPAKGAVINTMIDPNVKSEEEVKAPATETEQEQVPGEATQEETEG